MVFDSKEVYLSDQMFNYDPHYYYPYKDLCETGRQVIYTKDINKTNIDTYFNSAINILKDGIEKPFVQNMMIHVVFTDGIDIDLSLFDFIINLMMWQLCTSTNNPIMSVHLFFFEDITRRNIKEYIDNVFVDKQRKTLPFIQMNQFIDDVIGKFRSLRQFQMYLANTLNLEDTIELMNKYPEFNQTIHFDASGLPLEDVKDAGMEATNIQIKYIKNSDHCLRDSFRTGEAISPKQYKEVATNIGTKPDGQGSVFPHPINHSFMNGGLQTPEEICIESSVGRVAQILQKTNVGESGAFARNLELNNQDTYLHVDPNYICDTRNFEEVMIDSATKLQMYDLRYYRENPLGVDKLLEAKKCKDLVGRKLYFRSPITCASAARGQGICYKCYGDLAFANQEVNIGQIAAEALSSIYTQILLSAKHLLESLVVKMTWVPDLYEAFEITFNTIGVKTDKPYKNWWIIIDDELKTEEDLDDVTYSYYINSFKLRKPDGTEVKIHTTESDNIYFSQEFLDFVMTQKPKSFGTSEEDDEDSVLMFELTSLVDFPSLFIMEIRNNELSRTMDQIKKLIDNKSIIQSHDRNTILEEFIKTNISGGIKLNAVHFEVLLMNQFRDFENELEKPNWAIPNQVYQILTLSKSLSNNPSITVRLESNKIQQALRNPQNRFIKQPSITDLFFMEQPQEYLDEDIISDEYKPESDIENNIIQPISFDNPKIRVGRKVKKRKVAKSERNQ